MKKASLEPSTSSTTSGVATTKKATAKKPTTTRMSKPKQDTNSKTQDRDTLIKVLTRNEISNHSLRVSCYRLGISYGRMVESRNNTVGWLSLIVAFLANALVDLFLPQSAIHSVLHIVILIAFFCALAASAILTEKSVTKHVAEEVECLKQMADECIDIIEKGEI